MIQPINSVSSFDGAPSFNHPQLIRHLYENGLEIDRDILRDILALPHETLFEDLSSMLDDAYKRYDYFVDLNRGISADNFHEKLLSFPLHALFLLREVNCRRSLNVALNFLKSEDSDRTENYKFIMFWFGDHITETIWQVFFQLGNEREQELADFLFTRHVDAVVKSVASTALQQMVLHRPERARAILELFESVFDRFLTDEYDETIFDPTLVAMLVKDYKATAPELVSPLVQQLFKNGLVDIQYCELYESLAACWGDVRKYDIRHVRDIFGVYDHVVATWPSYQPERASLRKKKSRRIPLTVADSEPYELAPKIGRNEPCPCGSGKKYKKCCLE